MSQILVKSVLIILLLTRKCQYHISVILNLINFITSPLAPSSLHLSTLVTCSLINDNVVIDIPVVLIHINSIIATLLYTTIANSLLLLMGLDSWMLQVVFIKVVLRMVLFHVVL